VLDDRFKHSSLAETALLVDDGERRTRHCVAGHFDNSARQTGGARVNGRIDSPGARGHPGQCAAVKAGAFIRKLRCIALDRARGERKETVPAIRQRLFDVA
jgi:hypothetical protein